jgi:hypothetical protein
MVQYNATQAHPFRVDHYQGHRPIPGSASNPPKPDTTTPEGLALKGHQAFVTERYDAALTAYNAAADTGEAAAEIHLSIGLTHLYRRNLDAAADALTVASNAGVTDAQRILETLKP